MIVRGCWCCLSESISIVVVRFLLGWKMMVEEWLKIKVYEAVDTGSSPLVS